MPGELDLDLDYVGIIQGYPRSGKTALLREHVAAWGRRGAWVFVHDPDEQFLAVARHWSTAAAWRKVFAKGEPMPRVASVGEVAEQPVTELALEVAESLKAAGRAEPVFVGYDEAALTRNSAHKVDEDFQQLLARRRKLGVACAILCQSAGQLQTLWRELATDLYAFRLDAKKRVVQVAEVLRRLRPRHQYAHIQKGRIVGIYETRR